MAFCDTCEKISFVHEIQSNTSSQPLYPELQFGHNRLHIVIPLTVQYETKRSTSTFAPVSGPSF